MKTQSATTVTTGTRYLRTALILLIVVLAFVASYQIAGALGRSGSASTGRASSSAGLIPALAGGSTTDGGSTSAGGVATDGASPACACCGSSGTGETIEGAATLEGDVQRITVNTSNGYDPNVITLAAGVPAEITFKQASGCLAEVVSDDLGFNEDLTSGDKTIRLDAETLTPGTYGFSCGMQMVFGTIIVK